MSDSAKPRPRIDPWNAPFWEACAERRLVAQRCRRSGAFWLPPSAVSPVTRTSEWDWVPLSGRGVIWSWAIMHREYFASFAAELPYNVAQIELEEGPMLITNIVGTDVRQIEIGLPVEVVWETVDDELVLPKFAPASGSGSRS